jgi:surface antigen
MYRRMVLRLVVMSLGCLSLLALAPSDVAKADDLSYPHSSMPCIHSPYAEDGEGQWCRDYQWGPDRDNYDTLLSTRRYVYRNCTDYVAWKLESLGVASNLTRGLGNGGNWYANAAKKEGLARGTIPKIGAAAVKPPAGSDSHGHVAYVERVDKDASGNVTSITVTEYNYDLGGHGNRRSGKPADMGFTKFVYFGEHMTNPPDDAGGAPSNHIKRIKKTSFGSVQQLFAATESAVYAHEWWPGSNGIRRTQAFNAPDGEKIVDIDKLNHPDGVTQNLFVATTTSVYEVWWRGQGYSPPARLASRPGIRRIAADHKQEDSLLTHRLYVLADDGPHEFWWRAGTAVSGGYLLWNITNGLAIVKSVAADGADEVYVATRGEVYRMKWPVNGGMQRKLVTTLVGTVDIAKQTLAGGTELLYTATTTGVFETWWKPGTGFSAPVNIAPAPSGETIVGIEKRWHNATHQLYVATKGHVYEYWWNAGSGGVRSGPPLITVTQNTIVDIDKSVDGVFQQLYTAQQSFVYETWWGDGAVHNGEAIVNL